MTFHKQFIISKKRQTKMADASVTCSYADGPKMLDFCLNYVSSHERCVEYFFGKGLLRIECICAYCKISMSLVKKSPKNTSDVLMLIYRSYNENNYITSLCFVSVLSHGASAFRCVDLSACWCVDLSCVDLSACLPIGLSDVHSLPHKQHAKPVGVSTCRRVDLSACRHVGLSTYWPV